MSHSAINGNVLLNQIEPGGFFKTLLENAFDGITVVTYEGNVKYHSPSLFRILGYRPESGVGKSILELLHPDDVKIFRLAQKQMMKQKEKIFTGIVRFKHKNESWVILEARTINLMDQPGIEGFLINYRDITESAKLETALKESESRYKNLASVSPVGIFTTDPQGRCTYVNEKWCELSGLTYGESMGEGWSKTIHPDDIMAVWDNWTKAAAAKQPSRKTYRLCPPGKETLVYCQAVPEMDDSGNVIGYIGSVTDISERAEMEKAIQESEERYRNMVETAPEAIFILDANTGKCVDVNQNALNLFGYSREELLRMNTIDLSPPFQSDGKPSMELALEKMKEAFRGGKPVYEWIHKNSKGKTFPCETRLAHFPPYGKKLLLGTIIDITDRKKIEKKLREQEKDYRHLAAISPVGIFKTDIQGKTVYVNEKWCEIAGISAEEAVGNGWQNAIHPDDRKLSLMGWRAALKNKKESITEFRFKTPGGKVTWVYGQAKPDYDENVNLIGYVGSVTDINEIVSARDALRASEQTKNALLNAIPDMIFRISKDGVFLDYKAATGFGPFVPPEFFLGKKIKEVMPPDLAVLCIKNIKAAFKTKSIQTYEYSLPSADRSGENLFEARIVCNDSHEAVALIREVTQQKKAELALKASEERWKSLVTSAPQYIITVNSKNQITFINNADGLSPNQAVGLDVFDFIQFFSIDQKAVRFALSEARKGNHQTLEISVKNEKGKDIWFNVKSAPVKHNGKVEDLIVMALDITELKTAEHELRETNEKLQALYQRLETIREEEKKNIAMEIHDELGQELTAMKLGMFWLQQYIDQHKKKEGLDIFQIENKVKSLIDLSSQTISSARKLAHQLRPVVLDNLGLIPAIEWQIKSINESGKVKCEFRHNVSKIKFIDAFSVALFRIIQESLTNILRHSGAEKAFIDIHVRGKELMLAIEDKGKGIESKDITRSDKFGIFGIKERVKTWNGKFELKGSPRKGTSLRFSFPLKEIIKKHG